MMDLLSEYLSSWDGYYESSRNDSTAVIDDPDDLRDASGADWFVFSLLETLSAAGLLGNTVFLYIIFRYRHHYKPSYILLASLAFADIVHCLVMAAYFYPPIITKRNPFERLASRAIMSVEWAAWGVTLTHMLALAADRFVAVTFCHRYAKMITRARARLFVAMVWTGMLALSVGIMVKGHCCLIIPAPAYYTFTFEKSPKGTLNIYQKIFIPCESLTVAAVGVITPWTLLKYCMLRKRLKRDRHHGGGTGGGGGGSTNASRIMSLSKRESKVLLQIAVVTLIFFLYMLNYYLFYYIVGLTTKWETLFNSLMYCFNSMVHPFIYFGFNRILRKQLIDCCSGMRNCCCCCCCCGWCDGNGGSGHSGGALMTPVGGIQRSRHQQQRVQAAAASSPFASTRSFRFRSRMSGCRQSTHRQLVGGLGKRDSTSKKKKNKQDQIRSKAENNNENGDGGGMVVERNTNAAFEMGPVNDTNNGSTVLL